MNCANGHASGWWKIALIVLAAILAISLYVYLQPTTYESTALILLPRSRNSLTLSDEFRTITEPVDARSRMEALISISQSDELAQQALEELKGQFPDIEMTMTGLRQRIKISNKGDLILVKAASTDSDLAYFGVAGSLRG